MSNQNARTFGHARPVGRKLNFVHSVCTATSEWAKRRLFIIIQPQDNRDVCVTRHVWHESKGAGRQVERSEEAHKTSIAVRDPFDGLPEPARIHKLRHMGAVKHCMNIVGLSISRTACTRTFLRLMFVQKLQVSCECKCEGLAWMSAYLKTKSTK